MSEPTPGSVSSQAASPPRPSELPVKPSVEFLRKLAKDRLRAIRSTRPAARLFETQLEVAHEHGFSSWRELAAHLNAGQRGNVCRENGRVKIEGVAPLAWSGSDCTYLAAMANVLRVIGPAHDYVWLFGDSGLAFRMRFWANDSGTASCPSSPIGEMPPWTDFTERSIGWKMHFEVRLKGTTDDPNDMSDQLDQVTASIDAGLPVLGYFIKWDVGIAYGYEGSKLLVRDFHVGINETLVDITECRGLFAFFEERVSVPSREDCARNAISEAVSRWSHAPDRRPGDGGEGAYYYYGADAYERWTSLLNRAGSLTPDLQKALLHVDYWTFISLHDARQKAALYLRSIADLFPESADLLRQAAGIYQQIGEMTGTVIHEGAIFPAFYQPDALNKWTPEVRQNEIALLNNVRRLDQQAITLLGRAS
ncbi:MAG: hypothetical protein ABSB42_00590 [Tepidisphaeraceae bacterium]